MDLILPVEFVWLDTAALAYFADCASRVPANDRAVETGLSPLFRLPTDSYCDPSAVRVSVLPHFLSSMVTM